jgi:hypothetical protein
VPYIDWSPFFHTWELRGRYPSILNHEKHGEQARQLFADAQQLLERIITGNQLVARGLYGFCQPTPSATMWKSTPTPRDSACWSGFRSCASKCPNLPSNPTIA